MLRQALSSASSTATAILTTHRGLKSGQVIIPSAVPIFHWRLGGGYTLPVTFLTKILGPHTLRPGFSSVYFTAFIWAWAPVTNTRTTSPLTGTSVRLVMTTTGLSNRRLTWELPGGCAPGNITCTVRTSVTKISSVGRIIRSASGRRSGSKLGLNSLRAGTEGWLVV